MVDVERLQVLEQLLHEQAEKLRKTAEELSSGAIHPAHAANRLRKVAREIDPRGEHA